MKNRAIILIVLFYTHYSNGQSSKPNDAKSDTTSKEVYRKYPVSLYTPSPYLNKANMMIPKYDPKPPLFSIKTGNTEKVKVFLTISGERYDYRKP